MPIPIVIDDREQASGLPAALGRLGRVPELRRLALGDVMIGDKMLIERKAIGDLAASFADGRLDDQAARLATFRARDGGDVLLIVEGAFVQSALPGVELEGLRQALLTIQFDRGITVLRTENVEETAAWIVALARRREANPAAGRLLERSAAPLASAPAPSRSPRTPKPVRSPETFQLAALSKIPGIGPARAKALFEKFRSVGAIQAASEAEWRSVRGIGPDAAEALRRHFLKPYGK